MGYFSTDVQNNNRQNKLNKIRFYSDGIVN